jgi:hypothetical protein
MTRGKLNQNKEGIRKHPCSHPRKSSTWTEAKIPKIVKSSSSTEKSKLETLYSPKIGSHKVIKSHEDSYTSNSKSKSSSNMSFWGSPDLSPGIQKLFDAINVCENSKAFIILIICLTSRTWSIYQIWNYVTLTAYFHAETYGIQVPRHNHQGLMLRTVIFNLMKENQRKSWITWRWCHCGTHDSNYIQ